MCTEAGEVLKRRQINGPWFQEHQSDSRLRGQSGLALATASNPESFGSQTRYACQLPSPMTLRLGRLIAHGAGCSPALVGLTSRLMK